MLESGGVLRTWALAELPRAWGEVAGGAAGLVVAKENVVAAEALGDHRLAYLDYEGPVSGGRGTVRRLDCGECEIRERGADVCVASLAGGIVRGVIELRRTDGSWTLEVG